MRGMTILAHTLTVLSTERDMYYHLRNSSGTGWCVAGTSDGLFTGSWDRINPGKPAQDAVYGAPYTGCGHVFHVYYHSNGTTTWQYVYQYPLHSSTPVRDPIGGSITCSSGEYEDYHALNSYDLYARGCCDRTPSTVCPITGSHLPESRAGRPYSTLISPGVPATPETYPYTGAPHGPHIDTNKCRSTITVLLHLYYWYLYTDIRARPSSAKT